MITTWRDLLVEAMSFYEEEFSSIKGVAPATLTLELLNREAVQEEYNQFPFTIWTERRVYFPTSYDGYKDVGSVPRHPSDEVSLNINGTDHQRRLVN